MNTIVNHYVWAAKAAFQSFDLKLPASARLINAAGCRLTDRQEGHTTSGDAYRLTFLEDISLPKDTRTFAIHFSGAAIPYGDSFRLAFDDEGEPAYVFEVF